MTTERTFLGQQSSSRWLLVTVLAIAGVLGGVLAADAGGKDSGDVLRVRRIELVDDKDRPRIVLSVDGEEATVNLLDSSGQSRLILLQRESVTSVGINDGDGITHFFVLDDGSATGFQLTAGKTGPSIIAQVFSELPPHSTDAGGAGSSPEMRGGSDSAGGGAASSGSILSFESEDGTPEAVISYREDQGGSAFLLGPSDREFIDMKAVHGTASLKVAGKAVSAP